MIAQALRDGVQQQISEMMAERIVGFGEMINIDQRQRTVILER
jgi:hypothetical protein